MAEDVSGDLNLEVDAGCGCLFCRSRALLEVAQRLQDQHEPAGPQPAGAFLALFAACLAAQHRGIPEEQMLALVRTHYRNLKALQAQSGSLEAFQTTKH